MLAEQVGTVTNTVSVALKEQSQDFPSSSANLCTCTHTLISFPHAEQQLFHNHFPHSTFIAALTIILTSNVIRSCTFIFDVQKKKRGESNRLQRASGWHRGKMGTPSLPSSPLKSTETHSTKVTELSWENLWLNRLHLL